MRPVHHLAHNIQTLLAITLIIVSTSHVSAQTLTAPNPSASPINQRRGFGNGCGPASLLNAFQFGSEKWQRPFNAVPGNDSRTRLRHLINTWGKKPSKHIKGRQRWNHTEGVNLLDLTDIANEMRSPHFLPKVKYEVMNLKKNESHTALLKRVHARLSKSLKKGLPPIISIRRYAFRNHPQIGQKTWWPIRAHFVVVTEIPAKFPNNATSFKIRYIDPFGGFKREGRLVADPSPFTTSPFIQANFPTASVGKKFIKPGEKNTVSLSAIIGAW